jgi:TolA-binding protein
MLKTRIGVILVTLAAIAFPALAVAAVAADKAPIGPAETKGVQIGALQRPAKDFHKAIETAKQKIRAQHRRQREREREQAYAPLPGGVSQDTLETIAACESGGDPTAVSADGSYRGKYQFDYGTWASVGGSGDPAAAPEAEQDYRAALLYAQSGSSPWPVCGV